MAVKSKPNIVLVMTDQQSHFAMGCAGNNHLNTPAMDLLADLGTRFTSAYTTQPLCIPARVSLFTGRFPHEWGVTSNTREAPLLDSGDVPWLGRLLSDAGYKTVYLGKWHLVVNPSDPEVRRRTGFEEGFMLNADHLLADACSDFLEEWLEEDEKDKKPFFMVISFINPHNICQFARRDPLPNGDVGVPPPGAECPPLPRGFEIPTDEPEVIRWVQESNRKKLYPTANWTDDDWRQYLWAYYRMVELVDVELQKIISKIQDAGILSETVILFTSDHGEGLAAKHWNQKQVLYENVVRVPLIINDGRFSGEKQGNGIVKDLVSTGPDIYATICDYAGIQPPPGTRGISLRKVIEHGEHLDREFIVVETQFTINDRERFKELSGLEEDFEYPTGRMVRSGNFKYVVYSHGITREQLFDVENDPFETRNLATDPAFKDVLDRQRAYLLSWCHETGDDFPCIPPGSPANPAS